jgi:UDP-2-acetamido-3-amino-2,3-dideoxy-glucuronate N-acetyltransferase
MGHLAAVCDPSAKVLKELKATYKGLRVTSKFDDLLKDPKTKAVAIAAPAVQHYELARKALLADKDVFVEKPLSLRVPDAEELVELARKRKRVLMVGHILEYHPAVRKLKEFADSGELGDIHYVYSNRLNLGRSGRRRTSSGALPPTTSRSSCSWWARCRSGPRRAGSTTCATKSRT